MVGRGWVEVEECIGEINGNRKITIKNYKNYNKLQ